MLTRFKKQVQDLLVKEAELLHRIGLTPNYVSGVGVLFGFLAGYLYWSWNGSRIFLILASLSYLVSGLFDVLDGIVARLYGETTVFGGFLDSLLDRYVDAFVLVAILSAGLCDVFLGSVALVGSFLVSYSRARAEATGTKMEMIGLAERAERIIILTSASFAAFFYFEALNIGIVILGVFTNLTVLQRTLHIYQALKHKQT